jgi:hypothetical protein
MVYLSDLFTAITMLTTKNWSNGVFAKCNSEHVNGTCVVVPFSIGKWIFVGCIIFGYLLVRVFTLLQFDLAILMARTAPQSDSSFMRLGRQRRSSSAATSHTRSPMSWPTITTAFVGISSRRPPSNSLINSSFRLSQVHTTISASLLRLKTQPRKKMTLRSSYFSPSKVPTLVTSVYSQLTAIPRLEASSALGWSPSIHQRLDPLLLLAH